MSKSLMIVVTMFLAAVGGLDSALAASVSCRASNKTVHTDAHGAPAVVGRELKVPVTALSGAEIPQPSKPILIGNSKVSATYRTGDTFEPQTLLKMTFDDTTTTIYDVKPSLYMVEKSGVQFQCLVE